mmetsp:Transcript_42977/g.105996  ORF Transcript_42977/g.105996 Transcript_42977/m.105996 type:complete len:382 (+) Transcript_42977:224-1369(+)
MPISSTSAGIFLPDASQYSCSFSRSISFRLPHSLVSFSCCERIFFASAGVKLLLGPLFSFSSRAAMRVRSASQALSSSARCSPSSVKDGSRLRSPTSFALASPAALIAGSRACSAAILASISSSSVAEMRSWLGHHSLALPHSPAEMVPASTRVASCFSTRGLETLCPSPSSPSDIICELSGLLRASKCAATSAPASDSAARAPWPAPRGVDCGVGGFLGVAAALGVRGALGVGCLLPLPPSVGVDGAFRLAARMVGVAATLGGANASSADGPEPELPSRADCGGGVDTAGPCGETDCLPAAPLSDCVVGTNTDADGAPPSDCTCTDVGLGARELAPLPSFFLSRFFCAACASTPPDLRGIASSKSSSSSCMPAIRLCGRL